MNHEMDIILYCPECNGALAISNNGFEYAECISRGCALESIKFIVPNIELKRLIEGDEVCH